MATPDLMDRLYYAEWCITQRRGRVGKAVRRTYPDASDASVQATAEYISEGLTLKVSGLKSDFVQAYRDVESCMWSEGDICHEAYSKVGIQIATLWSGDDVVARCLVRYSEDVGFLAYKVYGDAWYNLRAALDLLGGVLFTDHWLDGLDRSEIYAARLSKHTIAAVNVFKTESVPVTSPHWAGIRHTVKHTYIECRDLHMQLLAHHRPYLDGY